MSQALPLDSAAEGAGYKLFGQLLDFMGLSEDLPAATKVRAEMTAVWCGSASTHSRSLLPCRHTAADFPR